MSNRKLRRNADCCLATVCVPLSRMGTGMLLDLGVSSHQLDEAARVRHAEDEGGRGLLSIFYETCFLTKPNHTTFLRRVSASVARDRWTCVWRYVSCQP